MKNISKFLCYIFLIFFCSNFFAGCEMFLQQSEKEPEPELPAPTEIMVEGYKTEVVVGESHITKLKVSQLYEGEWEDVPKADYVYTCDYDTTKWGEYEMKVYLKEYPELSFTDTITVTPIIVTAPTFSTIYSGEMVDISTELMKNSNGRYTVSSYTNFVNAGTYEATLELTNTNKYVWATDDGYTTNLRKKVNWTIEKAPAKSYQGATQFEVNSGDNLYDLIHNSAQTNLKYLTFLDVDMNEAITQDCTIYAKYNENSSNYHDSGILMFNIVVKNV